jgi:hypothetical protein
MYEDISNASKSSNVHMCVVVAAVEQNVEDRLLHK